MIALKSSDVTILANGVTLNGILTTPPDARGMVLFVHGSGSSRYSPRNQQVAHTLNEAGFATLLFDLLSADENEHDAITAEYRFNIALLAKRLIMAIDWISERAETGSLPIGLFGASTGAAAALVAAAERPQHVYAVVSRGGRPDLAGDHLIHVSAPTLLIVGGWDTQVEALNVQAAERMTAPQRLIVVPEATHLFEEPGKLEEVAKHAVDWFETHCQSQRSAANEPEVRSGTAGR